MFKNIKHINSLGLKYCLLHCVLVIDRSLGLISYTKQGYFDLILFASSAGMFMCVLVHGFLSNEGLFLIKCCVI